MDPCNLPSETTKESIIVLPSRSKTILDLIPQILMFQSFMRANLPGTRSKMDKNYPQPLKETQMIVQKRKL